MEQGQDRPKPLQELNAGRHTVGTSALADAKKAGELPFGFYARGWLDAQAVKASQGKLKQRTADEYARLLRTYVLPTFGGLAVAAVTPAHCEALLTALVRKQSRQSGGNPLTPGTVKHAWDVTRRVLKYALQHGAITANPTDRVDFSANRATGDHTTFEHRPLTVEQIGALSGAIAGQGGLPAYPVYALMVEFMAYTGLRAAEVAGLEVGDLTFAPGLHGAVNVRRTKERKATPATPAGRTWVTGTLKNKRSRRTVPMPDWLAELMAGYLRTTHPNADDPAAPLWPSRKNGGGHRAEGERYAVPFDWAQPLAMGSFYDTIMKPALEAVGLPASRPAVPATDTAPAQPATKGVRLHDLRHTFAVMHLMAGTHFMQVTRWLGHSTFTLTLNTYGDWIPDEDDGGVSHLPEPPSAKSAYAPGRATAGGNVVPLFGAS